LLAALPLNSFLLVAFSAVLCLPWVAGSNSTPPEEAASTQTILTFTEKIEVSDAGNGSYFPSHVVEERAGWPRQLWPRGEARSRRILVDIASRELDAGAIMVLFAGAVCPHCAMILDLFRELDVPTALVDYSTLDEADEEPDGNVRQTAGINGMRYHASGKSEWGEMTVSQQVKRALKELDVTGAQGSEEPAVFLGTRLLGMALEVEGMYYSGELHARLRVYGTKSTRFTSTKVQILTQQALLGVLPRSMRPVNRAPVIRIQPRATRPEAERLSVSWQSSWVHPNVIARLQVRVIEARGLTAFGYSYDALQRKVVRGALPTHQHLPPSIFGKAVSNPFVQLELEGVTRRSQVQQVLRLLALLVQKYKY